MDLSPPTVHLFTPAGCESMRNRACARMSECACAGRRRMHHPPARRGLLRAWALAEPRLLSASLRRVLRRNVKVPCDLEAWTCGRWASAPETPEKECACSGVVVWLRWSVVLGTDRVLRNSLWQWSRTCDVG
eukprot:6396516-Alexandrium_andersonii.AAC.2